ncbi:MAG: entericidin EcnAB [Gammaproteobacteria bacterium]|nr:entericidin EcnAB [Gammaproteobacteria bacterium]MDH5734564.1 entericidin EcnAB [Gammaproteobacteria bacterium]
MTKTFIVICVLNLLWLTACSNTLQGVGKDLEKIGEDIQKNVKRISE